MKIKIGETQYDAAEIGRLSLYDLIELKKQTGLDVDDITGPLEAMKDDESLISTGSGVIALAALVWLARRKAGETLTLEEATDFPLEDLEFIDDEEEEVQEQLDPQSA